MRNESTMKPATLLPVSPRPKNERRLAGHPAQYLTPASLPGHVFIPHFMSAPVSGRIDSPAPSIAQKTYFKANCNWRVSLALPVTRPKEPLLGSTTGLLQLGWFRILNISKRNCRVCFSTMPKFLRRLMSQEREPGPRRMLRGCTPKVPVAGLVNAALLNQTAELVNAVTAAEGSPERVQNWLPLPVPTPAISSLVRTESGTPDWNWLTPDNSQPPSRRWTMPLPSLKIGSS